MNIEELKELYLTKDNIGYVFDSLLNKALDGDDDARRGIENLTSKDSQIDPTIINPTVSMWYGACNKAIRATMQGNKHGLDIFKYLTSDECHMASKTLGSYFLKYIMDDTVDIARSEKHNALKSPAYFLSFAILTHLTSPDCKVPPSQEAVDQLFREKVDLALNQVLAGSDAVMDTIKILTRKDCNIQPTIDMWRDACNTVIRSTLEGNGIGLNIFKHLTSDECHAKSERVGSKEAMGSDFLELIMNSTVNIASIEKRIKQKLPAHDLYFSILTYLTSQDCKVWPSQEGVDQLFSKNAHQYVEREHKKREYLASKDSALKGFETNLVTMKNESFEPTYVIKYLTSDYCSVRPSQKEVDSFFAQLINAYTETKYFGLEALESTRDRFFNAIIHLISNKCNRHPSLQIVHDSIEALTQADSKRKGDIKSAILDLEREAIDIKSTKILNLSLIETYRTSLEDCQLLYLQEILTMYLQTLPEASEHIREADSKKFFKYCTDQSERFDKVMKIIKTVDPQDQFTI